MDENILDDDLAEGGKTQIQPQFASFMSRVGAHIMDTCVFIPIIFLSQYNVFSIKSLFLELLLSCTWIIYKPYMEYKYGATLGKMIMKIKVVNTQFQAIDSDQAVKRFLVFFVGYVGLGWVNYMLFTHPDFINITDYVQLGDLQQSLNAEFIINVANIPLFVSVIAVLFDRQNQGLHDQFAQTYCVYNFSR